MTTFMVILGLLAAVAAIGAAIRVQNKHAAVRAQSTTDPTETQLRAIGSIQEAESPLAQQPIAHPDRDLTATPTAPIVLSPVLPVPPPEVPLATSLSVSEVVESPEPATVPRMDAIAGAQSFPDETDTSGC
jgi:hypothetical protein